MDADKVRDLLRLIENALADMDSMIHQIDEYKASYERVRDFVEQIKDEMDQDERR